MNRHARRRRGEQPIKGAHVERIKPIEMPHEWQVMYAKARIEEAVRIALRTFEGAEITDALLLDATESVQLELLKILKSPDLMPAVRCSRHATDPGRIVVDIEPPRGGR
jgi:hypothetical protein